MKTSALKHNYFHSVPTETKEEHKPLSENDLIELFPQPRYFQIHFQHIHDNADALRREVEQLKQTINSLDQKVASLLSLLNTSSKQARD